MTTHTVSRRTFLAVSATLPWALRASGASSIPVGLELYSVRKELQRDQQATVRAVAKMGYQCVEFYAPYFAWSEDETKQMRKLLDDLGIRCYSTHNDSSNVNAENIAKTSDRNLILGCKYVVVASSHPQPTTLDGWKTVADALNSADDQLEKSGLHAGYHNHEPEFTPIGGGRPMEVIAKNTKPSIMLQLDVGTCLKAGSDPVAWIRSNPGRIRSLHLKEWSSDPAKAYSVLFGEGNADWKGILTAAESVGGVEYYLIEQEGSRFSEFETAERCLQAYRAVHPG
ncbi:MAG TPA: sugar phosphate isomerase/epimerase family protein [Candidatus Acidoferrum sp.]|nr:sugar phosphate isomerase/epimerase family protein [Candidatus Acidoferrum sp.]